MLKGSRKEFHGYSTLGVAIGLFFLTSCAAAPFLIPAAIEFGRNLLMTSNKNYGPGYAQDVNHMLQQISQPYRPTTTGIQPGIAGGGNQFTGPEGAVAGSQGIPVEEEAIVMSTEAGSPVEGSVAMMTGQEEMAESQIQLDVALVKKKVVNGAVTVIPIRDGDILKDGRGDPHAGDKFRIMFRANTDCYVYVIAIDGSAWVQGVFPPLTSPFANPIVPGEQYVIPEGENWFSLDQFRGIETIFFVASPFKRDDLEGILSKIAGRERHPQDTPEQVREPAILPAAYQNHIQGTSPFVLPAGSSTNQGILPTTFFTQRVGEALRVTRWFRHQ